MTIESEQDLLGLMAIGRICGQAVRLMADALEPGISTAELDAIGAAFLREHGARSAPIVTYKFPGHTCISINDEAAHGIPGDRVVQPGDLVNIDVSAELNGYYADTGATFPVPPVSPQAQQLVDTTRQALDAAIGVARAGAPLNAVGRAVQDVARAGGCGIIRDLPGHGVGRALHERPQVFNYFHKRLRQPFKDGLVVTLEPFLTTGSGRIKTDDDGWTLRTVDGGLCAQYEHTVIITEEEPILVTAV
jgi:methionyl aminopeptidase